MLVYGRGEVMKSIENATKTGAACAGGMRARGLFEWKNCLLMVSLKDASLRALKLNADGKRVIGQQTYFKNRFGRLRDICVSPSGKVYLCTSNGSNGDVLVEISK